MLVEQTNFSAQPNPAKPLNIGKVVILFASFVFIVAGSILITPLPGAIPTKPGSATIPLPGGVPRWCARRRR